MTASTSHSAGKSDNQGGVVAATVRVLLTVIADSDLEAALAVVSRQVYEPAPEIVIVGGEPPSGMVGYPTLEEAIADSGQNVDYLWLLHSDARPRPDALAALVREMERNEASLGGSKLLVAGSRDELEEVGSATDVFGEPYSGLEEGEIDLQQYDVVREVAFVRSASMLARRDLAQGLRGLDELLPPISAGLDFSQRTRLAGGKVISVPSSEVYHQRRCGHSARGWREQAGRLRAMLIAYRPLTLLWVIPYDILVAVLDSIANLLLLRWRPAARHALSWLWNLAHLPSTLARRGSLKKVRVAGDEELFRFQAKGSVRLREVGSELSSRALSVFDDDETLSTRSRRFLGSPGIWGAILATLIAVIAARSIFFSGMPNTGFAFPFEAPSTSIDRWFAGWNRAGLGAPNPVHPSVITTAAASIVAFGATEFARTFLTLLLSVIGVAGMGRLGGRLGLRGPGRYLAGLVLLAGPGTALLTGAGSWLALAGAAVLPWMVRAVLVLPGADTKPWRPLGWAVLFGVTLASLTPLLVAVPLLVTLVVPTQGVGSTRLRAGLAGLLGGIAAVPFLLGNPSWLLDSGRRLMPVIEPQWPILIAIALGLTLLLEQPWRRVGVVGGLSALAALVVSQVSIGGPGVEEAVLIGVSFGAALLVAVCLDLLSRDPRRLAVLAAGSVVLALSVGPFLNGRFGLPAGDINDELGYTSVLVGDTGPGRVLLASVDRSDLPGESRPGPGFWYRVVDAAPITHDQVWLSPSHQGDQEFEAVLHRISRGDELHPGAALAEFAIDWVVLEGEEFRLDTVLATQLDLARRMFDPETRVFENLVPRPLAGSDTTMWQRSGAGFEGEPDTQIRIATIYDQGWRPAPVEDGWSVLVDATQGEASFRGSLLNRMLPVLALLLSLAAVVSIGYGRSRR